MYFVQNQCILESYVRSYNQSQYGYSILTPHSFKKHIICWFWTLTSNDLSWAKMTSDPTNSKRLIPSLVSAFQKHSVWKKSKNSLFRSIFKYELRGLKWPETKIIPQRLLLTIPHHPSCTSITIPHHPSQSLTIPHHPSFSVFYVAVVVILYY